MLTKPISMSPDATIVHADDGHIKLMATFPTSCSLETFVKDGVEYCYASLFMSDGQNSYRIIDNTNEDDYKDHFYPTYIKENDGVKVTYDLDLSNERLQGICHTFTKDTMKKKYIKINSLNTGIIYRWKIRVYDKNSILNTDKYVSNNKIGYGSVSGTKRYLDDYNNVISGDSVLVSIFAHTNIYDWVLGEAPHTCYLERHGSVVRYADVYSWYYMDKDYQFSVSDGKTLNVLDYVMKVVNYIDNNNMYYLKINGTQYPILKYRQTPMFFAKPNEVLLCEDTYNTAHYLPSGWWDNSDRQEYRDNIDSHENIYSSAESLYQVINGFEHTYGDVGSVTVESSIENDFDSYGNPISGYALIDTGGEIPCEDNTTYTLCCNYIDSDEGYFEIYSKPTVSLTEENAGLQFTDTEDNIVIGTESNPYTLTYCNVNISAVVSQSEGVEHEYYYYKIYEYSNNGRYEIIHHSGNIYNTDIRVTYDDFLDNRNYKLVISIVDANQQTIERELYFKTDFPYLGDNSMVKAEYYRDHNSVVVEWSLGNSISPTIKNNNYEYVALNDAEKNNAVVIGEGNEIIYTQNDFGQKLNFENSTFALKFKLGANAGDVAEVHTKDGYFRIYSERDIGSTCDNRIVVETRNGCYYSEIKRIAGLEEAIEALSTGVSPTNRTLQWNNELVWNDDYIWVNGQDTNADEYLVVVNSNDRVRIINLTIDEEFEVLKRDGSGDFIPESKIMLYGDTTFMDVALINDSDIFVMNNLVDNEWLWTEGTQVMCSFDNTLNGAMAVTPSNSKLIGYKIYKTIGDSIKLYKIADIDNLNYNVIEDFVVGDNCKYQYYLFPIYQDVLNDKILYCCNPVLSNEITLHQCTDKVFGLKKIKDNIYCVDLDNVWRIQLNLDDAGYTLNNTKTFFDTLNTYQQEYVGNMKYITKSVSGLIGAIDCNSNSGEIVDTYDMLTSWNEFATSGTPKCLVDIRGIILPGNFEANPTIEYLQGRQALAVAKFNWRQKSDLNIINIYSTVLPYNPVSGVKYLRSRDGLPLVSSDDKVLLASEGDVL